MHVTLRFALCKSDFCKEHNRKSLPKWTIYEYDAKLSLLKLKMYTFCSGILWPFYKKILPVCVFFCRWWCLGINRNCTVSLTMKKMQYTNNDINVVPSYLFLCFIYLSPKISFSYLICRWNLGSILLIFSLRRSQCYFW